MALYLRLMNGFTFIKKKFEDLVVIFSGGDALRLSKPFKNRIFANTNFLAKGLNFILVSNLS